MMFWSSIGYPNITNLKKKPRESTDLAEYIFLDTNNFFQLQIVKKLELRQDWQKIHFSENLRVRKRFVAFRATTLPEPVSSEKHL